MGPFFWSAAAGAGAGAGAGARGAGGTDGWTEGADATTGGGRDAQHPDDEWTIVSSADAADAAEGADGRGGGAGRAEAHQTYKKKPGVALMAAVLAVRQAKLQAQRGASHISGALNQVHAAVRTRAAASLAPGAAPHARVRSSSDGRAGGSRNVLAGVEASYAQRELVSNLYNHHPPTVGPHPYDEYCVCPACIG